MNGATLVHVLLTNSAARDYYKYIASSAILMFRINYPFYQTVLWSAKRVKKVKLFGRTCLRKFAKSLREFLSSFCVIAVFLEV